MAFSDYIARDHAYPLLVVIYTNLMLYILVMEVVGYRKKHNIKYPIFYHKTDVLFNCYQRAHENTLENLPIFYSLFIPAGVVYPRFASVAGFAFVTARFMYAYGCYTGEPSNRRYGTWGSIPLLILLGTVLCIALSQLGLMSTV